MRQVAERLWKRDDTSRWNHKIDMMRDADKAAKKAAKDPAWRARFEKTLARQRAKLEQDHAIREGWHDFAYVEDGPTPDWVRSLGDEDPDPDSMVA